MNGQIAKQETKAVRDQCKKGNEKKTERKYQKKWRRNLWNGRQDSEDLVGKGMRREHWNWVEKVWMREYRKVGYFLIGPISRGIVKIARVLTKGNPGVGAGLGE